MTFLHCNLDGSLSRRVTPYLEVNFDLVLDRSDLPDSLFLVLVRHVSSSVKHLQSVHRIFSRQVVQ